MALVKFKDLPDTTTPITADNLNNNFEELENNISNISEKTDLGFAELVSNTDLQIISTDTLMTWWSNNSVSYGDLEAQPSNSRIKITNTEILEFGGTISGINNVLATFVLVDEQNNNVDILGNKSTLYSFNTYFTAPLKTLYAYLDKTKTYYLSLKLNKYGDNAFELNHGFGTNGTTMYAKKLK